MSDAVQHPLEGDPEDFSQTPYRGYPRDRPNDFFSYYVTEEDEEKTEYLITASPAVLQKCRRFIRRVEAALPALGERQTVLVRLKCGVNTRHISDLTSEEPGSSFGGNRSVGFA